MEIEKVHRPNKKNLEETETGRRGQLVSNKLIYQEVLSMSVR